MEQRDSFNLLEKERFGYFYMNMRYNKSTFFATDKYSGLYPSEILDIKYGNDKPYPKLIVRW